MIIALLTDFGTRDYFVGAMKGVIFSINENAKIVDITHEIPPQDIIAAGFTLRACYKDFPQKTIFTAIVDPGVGSERRGVLVETEEYFFIAPDNGLLSFICNRSTMPRVYELTNKKYFNSNISATFHGRDIFAPCAAHLSKGISPEEFGNEITDLVFWAGTRPRKLSENLIEADIIHVDRFGNLITNLKSEDLPGKFSVEINGRSIGKIQNYFAEAEKDEIFMIFGSAGNLEIVAFCDSAKNLLSAETGQKIVVTLKS